MSYTLYLPRWSKIVLWIGSSFFFLSYTNESDTKASQSSVILTLIIWMSLLQCSASIIPERRINHTSFFYYAFSLLTHKVVFSCFLGLPYCYKKCQQVLAGIACGGAHRSRYSSLPAVSINIVELVALTNSTIFILWWCFFERDIFHSQVCTSKPFFLKQNATKKEKNKELQ